MAHVLIRGGVAYRYWTAECAEGGRDRKEIVLRLFDLRARALHSATKKTEEASRFFLSPLECLR